MAYKTCPQCGKEQEAFEICCPACGADLSNVPEHATFYSEYVFSRLTPRGKEICERAFKGDAEAMCEYGRMLYNGKEGAREDTEGAYEWYLCAARSGCADGFYWAGCMQCNGEVMWEKNYGDFKEGVYLMRAGAKMGSVRCMAELGRYYLVGHGVNANDALARRYLTGAAAAGDRQSMLLAARCYLEGSHGFEHDLARAEALYARADAPHSMYNDLRNAYLTGNGLPQDDAKAEEMGEKYLQELLELYAAEPQKDVTCSYAWMIGREYLDRGEEERAAEWFKKAMESGDIFGRIELQHLKKL